MDLVSLELFLEHAPYLLARRGLIGLLVRPQPNESREPEPDTPPRVAFFVVIKVEESGATSAPGRVDG